MATALETAFLQAAMKTSPDLKDLSAGKLAQLVGAKTKTVSGAVSAGGRRGGGSYSDPTANTAIRSADRERDIATQNAIRSADRERDIATRNAIRNVDPS